MTACDLMIGDWVRSRDGFVQIAGIYHSLIFPIMCDKDNNILYYYAIDT